MNAARRRRQKLRRHYGGGHTGADHVKGERCLKCQPLPEPYTGPPRAEKPIMERLLGGPR